MSLLGNLDLGWDANYSSWNRGNGGLQVGYTWPDSSCPGALQCAASCSPGPSGHGAGCQSAQQAFQILTAPADVVIGSSSARIWLPSNCLSVYDCCNSAAVGTQDTFAGESSEEWWAWAWQFPTPWPGSNCWGTLFEMTTNGFFLPGHGCSSWDASNTDCVKMINHCGFMAAARDETFHVQYPLLGNAAKTPAAGTTGNVGFPNVNCKPFRTGLWVYFIWHVIWHSGVNAAQPYGVHEIWARYEDEPAWDKLVSMGLNEPATAARLVVNHYPGSAPNFPNLAYNAQYGAPVEGQSNVGANGLGIEDGFYSGVTSFTRTYKTTGHFRRSSFNNVAALFPGGGGSTTPPPPPPPPPGTTVAIGREPNATCSSAQSLTNQRTDVCLYTCNQTIVLQDMQLKVMPGQAVSDVIRNGGSTAQGSGALLTDMNHIRLVPAVPVTSLTAVADGYGWMEGNVNQQFGNVTKIRMLVYRDDGTGKPGAFLAASNEIQITVPDAMALRHFTFPTPFNLTAGQTYWIGYWAGGQIGTRFAYDDCTNCLWAVGNTYSTAGAPVDPFNTVNGGQEPYGLSCYLEKVGIGAGQTITVRPVVYADDGVTPGQAPGHRIAVGDSLALTAPVATGFHMLTFTDASPVLVKGTKYWLGFTADGTTDVARYNYDVVAAGVDGGYIMSGVDPPAIGGGGTFQSTRAFCLYGEGVAPGLPQPPPPPPPAVAATFCDYMFGTPGALHCTEVTPPARGTIAPIFTIESGAGMGPVLLQAYTGCGSDATDVLQQMEIGSIPPLSTVIVDCGRQRILIRENDPFLGVTVRDGKSLLVLPEGQPIEWLQVRDCDPIGCLCARTKYPCSQGVDTTVEISLQYREG